MPVLGADKLFQVTVKGTLLGQDWSNVFWFRDAAAGTSFALGTANDVDTNYMPQYAAFCNLSTFFTSIECINLQDDTDFAEITPSVTQGTVAGDPEPSYLAVAVKLLRETREVRNGWKRIPGIVEGDLSGNTIAAATVTRLTGLANLFDNALSNGQDPVIVRKTYVGDPPVLNPPSLWITGGIGDYEIVGITTQNSRKPGVGS